MRRGWAVSVATVIGLLLGTHALPVLGQGSSSRPANSCQTTGDATEAWLLAREWMDYAETSSGGPSPFKTGGWERVSKRLLSIARSASSPPRGFEGIAKEVLSGPDKDIYCAGLERVGQGAGPAQIAVPLELMQARDVVSALADKLPTIVSSLRTKTDIDERLVRTLVTDALKEHVALRRLEDQLRVLQAFLEGGNSLPFAKPADWPSNESWPPSAAGLSEWRRALKQAATTDVRICSDPALVPALLPADPVALVKKASLLSGLVTQWATSCLGPEVIASPAPSVPDVIPPSLVLGDYSIDPKPDTSSVFRGVSLTLTPLPQWTATEALSIELRSAIDGRTVREQLPLGIVVRRVSRQVIDGKNVATYSASGLTPAIDAVDLSELRSSLGRLGLPPFMTFESVDVELPENFRDLTLKGKATVPALGLVIPFMLPFQKGGKLDDPHAGVQTLAELIDVGVTKQLQAIDLGVDLQGLGRFKADGARVIGAASPTSKRIETGITLRMPAWLGRDVTVRAIVGFEIPLGGGRSSPRLIDAKFQPSEADRLLDGVSSKLQKALDSLELGRSACIQLQRLDLQSQSDGSIALVGTLAFRGRTEAIPLLMPLEPPGVDFYRSLPRMLRIDEGDLARCVRDRLLELAGEPVVEWAAKLNGTRISLFGTEFRFDKAEWAPLQASERPVDQKTRGWFRANLISSDDPALRFEGITVDGNWRPENGPPRFDQVTIQSVSLPTSTAERLLARYVPQVASYVAVRAMRYVAPNLAADVTLKLPAPIGEVKLDNMQLTAESIGASLRRAIQERCLQEIAKSVDQLVGPLAQSMGSVKIAKVSLNTGGSKLFEGERFAPNLVFDVTVHEENLGVTLPFKVTLPDLKIEAGADFDALVTAALKSVIDKITGPLGNLAAQAGAPISNLKAVVDTVVHRYGVAFDLKVKLAGTIDFAAEGIVVDQHGLTLPPSFKIDVPGPIVLSAFQLASVGGTLWREPAGKFQVRTNITFTGDSLGIALLHVALLGEGRVPVFKLEGQLKALNIPLLEVKGDADLSRTRVVLEAKTLDPLDRILSVNGFATLDRQRISIEQGAGLKILGFATQGKFDLDLASQKASLTGEARWAWLNTTAELGIAMTPDLRKAKATGKVELPFKSIKAAVELSTGMARMDFRVFGINVTIIAPSASAIDLALLERVIGSLLDFKFSWDALHKLDVTINLLDPGGQPASESAGGGDPLEREDPASPGPKTVSGPETLDPKKAAPTSSPSPPLPTIQGTSPGGGGNWYPIYKVEDRCAVSDAEYYDGEMKPGFGKYWTTVKDRTPGGILFEALHAAPYAYPKRLDGNYGRVATKETVDSLAKGPVVTCFNALDLPYPPYEVNGEVWETNTVAVVGSVQNGRPALRLLSFRVNSKPVDLALPDDAAKIIFGKTLDQAARSGWTFDSAAGERVLHAFADSALSAGLRIERMHALTNSALITEWRTEPKKAYLLEETIANDRQFHLLRADGEALFSFDTALAQHLGARPTGPLAELVAAAPDPEADLILDTKSSGSCLLAVAKANKDSDINYVAAIDGAKAGAIRLVSRDGPEPAELFDLLREYCPVLAKGVGGGEILVRKDGTTNAYSAAWWVREGQATSWYFAGQDAATATLHPAYCLTEGSFLNSLRSLSRHQEDLDWSAERPRHRMLQWLSGTNSSFSESFHSHPRGVFLRSAKEVKQPAMSCP